MSKEDIKATLESVSEYLSDAETVQLNNQPRFNLDINNPMDKLYLVKYLQKKELPEIKKSEILLKLEKQQSLIDQLTKKIKKLKEQKNPEYQEIYLKSKIEMIEKKLFEKSEDSKKVEDMIEIFGYNIKQKIMAIPFTKILEEKKKEKKRKK